MKFNKKYMNLLNKLFDDKKDYITMQLDEIKEEIDFLKKENEEETNLLMESVNELKRLVEGGNNKYGNR